MMTLPFSHGKYIIVFYLLIFLIPWICSPQRIIDRYQSQVRETVRDLLNHDTKNSSSLLQQLYGVNDNDRYKSVRSKVFILPVDSLGLANRLRIINSFFTPSLFPSSNHNTEVVDSKPLPNLLIADLVVLWFPDDACNAKFDDLFVLTPENNKSGEALGITQIFSNQPLLRSVWNGTDVIHRLTVINILNNLESDETNESSMTARSFHLLLWNELRAIQQEREHLAMMGNSTMNGAHQYQIFEHYPRRLTLSGPIIDYFHDMRFSSVHLIWTRGFHIYYPPSKPISDYGEYLVYYKTLFYKYLQPAVAIQNLIVSIKQAYFVPNSHVIGVHVRVSDVDQDWDVVSPVLKSESDNEQLQAMSFSNSCSMNSFVHAMKTMLHHYTGERDVTFFVASNSQQMKDLIAEELSDFHIITLSSDLGESRKSVYAVQFAVLEFFLLSDCEEILHTRSSSFAKEAAYRKNIPVIDVYDGRPDTQPLLLYTLNKDLLFYGIPEVYREAELSRADKNESSVQRICYQESDRSICTIPYSACPCNFFPAIHCYEPLGDKNSSQCVTVLAESNGYSL